MVEKNTSKKDKVSKVNIESSDDKIALIIMSFIVDILYSIFFIVLAYLAFWYTWIYCKGSRIRSS